MALPISVETRTGDTSYAKRQRQRQKPPDILITTPEQVSLLIADPSAAHLLRNLQCVIIDELHSIVSQKRGVLLSLALSRLRSHAPQARFTGLSATVADSDALCAWLAPAINRAIQVAAVEPPPTRVRNPNHLQVLDRRVRLAQLLGFERRAKQLPSTPLDFVRGEQRGVGVVGPTQNAGVTMPGLGFVRPIQNTYGLTRAEIVGVVE
jgi:hypothetical protein